MFKTPILFFLTLTCLISGLSSFSVAKIDGDIYYGLTILEPETKTRRENQYIWVKDGKIEDMGQGFPFEKEEGTNTHDFSGLYALPGLIDTHAHPTFGPFYLFKEGEQTRVGVEQKQDMVVHNAALLLGHGVTTIRDPGSDTAGTLKFRADIKAGLFPGPDSLTAGSIIDGEGSFFKGLTADRTNKSIPDIVLEQAEAGVDYVKLYQGLSTEELKEGIEAARVQNVGTIVDLGDVGWKTVSNLGVGSIAHAFPKSPEMLPPEKRASYMETRRGGKWIFIDWYEAVDLDAPEVRDAISAMRDNGTHFDATLTPWYLGFWNDVPEVSHANNNLIHPDSLANFKGLFMFNRGWTEDDYARAKAIWPKALKLTKMIYEAGVNMTIGTDHGNYLTAPGQSLHQEMELHAEAGIPNWDILTMATHKAAQYLGLGQKTGRLKEGLEADIIFLKADPSLTMGNIRSVEGVMTNGMLHKAEELISPYLRSDP